MGAKYFLAGGVDVVYPEENRGLYEEILRDEPGHADSLHMLGVLAHQEGRIEDADGALLPATHLNFLVGNRRLTAALDIGLAGVLWYLLMTTHNLAHPDSPVFASGSIPPTDCSPLWWEPACSRRSLS